MVLQSHRAILVRIDHGILPRKAVRPAEAGTNRVGHSKGSQLGKDWKLERFCVTFDYCQFAPLPR